MSDHSQVIIKKKKGHGDHGHHGGSWKVAYADFVTAMMAFFMVMWIMGLSEETRAQIAGYFKDPIGFMKNMPASKNYINLQSGAPQHGKMAGDGKDVVKEDTAAVKQVEKELDQALNGEISFKDIAKQVEMTMTSEGLEIEFVENTGAVFFETGSAVVRPEAKQLIGRLAPILARSGRQMIIEGHTDATPYAGTGYTNMDLSTDRAASLRRLLSQDGVAESQVLQVRGYGATKLKRPDDPTHFSNRRVTILLPFKGVTDPTLDLPKQAFETEKQAVTRRPIGVMPQTPDISHGEKPL